MFRVLGAVEINGPASVRGRAQRVLASALVLDRGVVVSADRLCDLIWGDDQPANPRAALQSQASRLRRSLPTGATLESSGTGYRLDVGAAPVDVAVIDNAFRSAEAGATLSLDAIDNALAVWRGEPYEELGDDDRARAEASQLDVARHALVELRAKTLLSFGRVQEAISDLERQRRDAPMRESTVALLMRAYVDAGRKQEALAAYQQLRTLLVEELGLDPSPELRSLESAILTESMTATSAALEPPPVADAATAAPTPINLPTSTFIGRNDDLERVSVAMTTSRIVTLVGPGGVGKTRLSLHAAAEAHGSADTIQIVELTEIQDGVHFDDLLVTVLDLRSHTGTSPLQLVLDHLASRSMLLVLDNCEHVIAEAAEFVSVAARHAPGVTILATSREALNVDGEHVVRIEPLTTGEAVALFIDRAARHGGFERGPGTEQLVERVVTALDGLPLSVELAAARSASMSLDEIEASLDERFTLLSRGRRTAPDRHRSLRALVNWSVQNLDDRLLDVFVKSSVFTASFTTDAVAEAIGSTELEALDAVTELVNRSLLTEVRTPGRRTRYDYLQTMRAYAREQLEHDTSFAEITSRHSDWVLDRVEHARALLPDQPDDDARWELMSMLADIRVAHRRFIDTDDADRGLRLIAALHFLAFFRMHTEMLSWIVEAADRFALSDHRLAEDVAGSASIAMWVGGDLDSARRYAELATDRANVGDHTGAGRAANEAWGDVMEFGGDVEAAREHFDRALVLAREQNDRARIVCNLVDGGLSRGYLGDTAGVRVAHAEARRMLGPTPAHLAAAWVAYTEGEALADADPDRALTALNEALELADEASLHFITGVAGLTRAGLQVRHGDPALAIPGLIDLLTQWSREGAIVQLAITLRLVIDVLVRRGRHEAAAVLIGGALNISGAEPVGADAVRMEIARNAVDEHCDDADALIAHGSQLSPDALASLAINDLRSITPS